MERCYVCNHCGKCDDDALAVAPPVLACLDCGHEVQPGESPRSCAVCGGRRIELRRGGGDEGAPA